MYDPTQCDGTSACCSILQRVITSIRDTEPDYTQGYPHATDTNARYIRIRYHLLGPLIPSCVVKSSSRASADSSSTSVRHTTTPPITLALLSRRVTHSSIQGLTDIRNSVRNPVPSPAHTYVWPFRVHIRSRQCRAPPFPVEPKAR